MREAGFIVMAEEFGKFGEGGRSLGSHPTRAGAIEAAQGRVDAGLREAHGQGMTADALLRAWTIYGEDVYILPDDPGRHFSALDYARLRCVQLTGDAQRPVRLEVTCEDRLNTASGAPSAAGQWTFWVRAPATYAGAPDAIRPAVEGLYREMSARAFDSDGSGYTLLSIRVRELTRDEADAVPSAPGGRFVLQADGRLVEPG